MPITFQSTPLISPEASRGYYQYLGEVNRQNALLNVRRRERMFDQIGGGIQAVGEGIGRGFEQRAEFDRDKELLQMRLDQRQRDIQQYQDNALDLWARKEFGMSYEDLVRMGRESGLPMPQFLEKLRTGQVQSGKKEYLPGVEEHIKSLDREILELLTSPDIEGLEREEALEQLREQKKNYYTYGMKDAESPPTPTEEFEANRTPLFAPGDTGGQSTGYVTSYLDSNNQRRFDKPVWYSDASDDSAAKASEKAAAGTRKLADALWKQDQSSDGLDTYGDYGDAYKAALGQNADVERIDEIREIQTNLPQAEEEILAIYAQYGHISRMPPEVIDRVKLLSEATGRTLPE